MAFLAAIQTSHSAWRSPVGPFRVASPSPLRKATPTSPGFWTSRHVCTQHWESGPCTLLNWRVQSSHQGYCTSFWKFRWPPVSRERGDPASGYPWAHTRETRSDALLVGERRREEGKRERERGGGGRERETKTDRQREGREERGGWA